jgi:hypothetical protein
MMIGVGLEARIARENLSTTGVGHNAERTGVSEISEIDVEAGIWLRVHTPSNSIAMARCSPTVSHYAERKVIWFAPISDPHVLLEGIVKHRVDYIVVVTHSAPYFLPDDDYCFARLYARHPETFQLVFEKANALIFKVDRTNLR